jgi:hypothetical protein
MCSAACFPALTFLVFILHAHIFPHVLTCAHILTHACTYVFTCDLCAVSLVMSELMPAGINALRFHKEQARIFCVEGTVWNGGMWSDLFIGAACLGRILVVVPICYIVAHTSSYAHHTRAHHTMIMPHILALFLASTVVPRWSATARCMASYDVIKRKQPPLLACEVTRRYLIREKCTSNCRFMCDA